MRVKTMPKYTVTMSAFCQLYIDSNLERYIYQGMKNYGDTVQLKMAVSGEKDVPIAPTTHI